MQKKGYSLSEIARSFGRRKSVIWYELAKKRKGRPYDAEYARQVSYVRMRRRRKVGKKIALNSDLRSFVEAHLLDDQSPEEIAKRIKKHEKNLPAISGTAIRRYIKSPYGRRIEERRRRMLKKRWRRHGPRKHIEGKRMITERPKKIERRWGLGHMEGDFIVSGRSGRGVIFGLQDRNTRKSLLERILPVSVGNVERALLRIRARYPEMQSITFDNDILFLEHRRLERKLGVRIYFCHPRSPWEKPSIENLNKTLRRYIPKSSDISKYSKVLVRNLEARMNRRFMDCLGSLTPDEAYAKEKKQKQRLAARSQWKR